MSLRNQLNNYPAATALIAVLLLAVALATVFWATRAPTVAAGEVYYWDIDQGVPFVDESGQHPPIEAPSGGQGARAYLYSCGECAPEEWFGYLTSFTEQGKRMLDRQQDAPGGDEPVIDMADLHGIDEIRERHRLIRPLDDEQWHRFESPAGDQIREETLARCGEAEIRRCRPGDL